MWQEGVLEEQELVKGGVCTFPRLQLHGALRSIQLGQGTLAGPCL